MIISWKEVRHLEDFIQKHEQADTEVSNKRAEIKLVEYFSQRPHLLMPCGFDEHISFSIRKQYAHMWFANQWGQDTGGESIYRKPNGRWFWLAVPPLNRTDFFSFDTKSSLHEEDYALTIDFDEFFKKLYRAASNDTPSTEERLWSPVLWTPMSQEKERSALSEVVKPLLAAIRSESLTLEDLTWKQLEEVVAEVLRASGLEIHIV